jgi:hypothetical protein
MQQSQSHVARHMVCKKKEEEEKEAGTRVARDNTGFLSSYLCAFCINGYRLGVATTHLRL